MQYEIWPGPKLPQGWHRVVAEFSVPDIVIPSEVHRLGLDAVRVSSLRGSWMLRSDNVLFLLTIAPCNV